MNQIIKKHLKILANRFEHTIEYHFNNDIIISNKLNFIKISHKSKNKLSFSYNCKLDLKEIEIDFDDLYDTLIQVLKRKSDYEIITTKYDLLTLEIYLENEGQRAQKEIEQLIQNYKIGKVENKILFGNRITPEIFNGIIILTDDLERIKSNVIDLEMSIESIKDLL